jgi:hypothetical protein
MVKLSKHGLRFVTVDLSNNDVRCVVVEISKHGARCLTVTLSAPVRAPRRAADAALRSSHLPLPRPQAIALAQ